MINKEEFVLIDGRKVPTEAGLEKMGLLKPNGEFVTIRSKVTDDDYKLSKDDVRTIVWNLKKYSSVTYMQRLKEVLEIVAKGYEKHVATKPEPLRIDIESLKYFHESIADLEHAIKTLLTGDKSAYEMLSDVTRFDFAFTGRMRFEYNWEPIGAPSIDGQKARGLFLWIEKAICMANKIEQGGTLTWPSNLTYEEIRFAPPSTFTYKHATNKINGKTCEPIPTTGIWNPFSFKSGCPSFLLAGSEFTTVEIASMKFERSEYVDEHGIYHEGWVDYEYEEHPSNWELLWEDTRYLDGTIPEEEADYLDESCSFPDEPPEAIGN